MKRYIVFMYDNFYPTGGWHDYLGRYDTKEEAKEAGLAAQTKTGRDYVDIVDLETNEIVLWHKK
jgi:hypothetical protein